MSGKPARLRFMRLPHGEGLELPGYATAGAAGMDVRAAVLEPLAIAPRQVALVPTGLKVEVPPGYELQVRPRSGLALKSRVTLLNSPGTIDSDYRGELQVILCNLGEGDFVVNRGDRVAQLVLAQVARAEVIEVAEVADSGRGEGGFGHTGVS